MDFGTIRLSDKNSPLVLTYTGREGLFFVIWCINAPIWCIENKEIHQIQGVNTPISKDENPVNTPFASQFGVFGVSFLLFYGEKIKKSKNNI